MKQTYCYHVNDIADVHFDQFLESAKATCEDCNYGGRSRWLCTQNDCLLTYCGDKAKDHSANHSEESKHSVLLNVSSWRLWCSKCEVEVNPRTNTPSFPLSERLNSHAVKIRNKIGASSAKASWQSNPAVYGAQSAAGCSFSRGKLIEENTDIPIVHHRTDHPTTHVNDMYQLSGGGGRPYIDRERPTALPGFHAEPDDYENPRGLAGLRNVGNTCYFNSAIQALSNCEPLAEYMRTFDEYLDDRSRPRLTRSFHRLIKELWSSDNRQSYILPTSVLNAVQETFPMFRGFAQQDSQELLRCLLDKLHEELKEPIYSWQKQLYDETDSNRISFSSSSSDSGMKNSDHSSSSDESYLTCYDSDSNKYKAESLAKRSKRSAKRRHAHSEGCSRNRLYDSDESDFSDANATSPTRRSLRSQKHHKLSVNTVRSSSTSGLGTLSYASADTLLTSQPTAAPSVMESHSRLYGHSKPLAYRSVITDIFDGKLLSMVQCLACSRISKTYENFQDLSLPIPSADQLSSLRASQNDSTSTLTLDGASSMGSAVQNDGYVSRMFGWLTSWFWGPTITLEDCLAYFFSSDELKGDNMYSCEKCKKLRNGIKFCKLLELPELLCIHLKRFRHDFAFASKISAPVTFPLDNLDLKPFLHRDCKDESCSYDLVAMITHYGNSGGGHYVAFCKNYLNDRWYEYNDSLVSEVDWSTVESSEAYVLFYRKNNDGMTQIRQEVNRLLYSYRPSEPMKFYISKQWINRFNTFAEPGPVTNYDFLCPHGCIHPMKVNYITDLYTEINYKTWQYIVERYGGGPMCSQIVHCKICTQEMNSLRCRRENEAATYKKLHNQSQQSDMTAHSDVYAIAMKWYQQWRDFVQNQQYEPPGPIDNKPLIAIREGVEIMRRNFISHCAYIPRDIWEFFYTRYGGGPEILYNRKDPRLSLINVHPVSVDHGDSFDVDQGDDENMVNSEPESLTDSNVVVYEAEEKVGSSNDKEVDIDDNETLLLEQFEKDKIEMDES